MKLLKGFNKPRQFIAAQGPTKDTCVDFLRMIYEKDVKQVIMLTQLYEGDPPMVSEVQLHSLARSIRTSIHT